jgi:hypothetical protein
MTPPQLRSDRRNGGTVFGEFERVKCNVEVLQIGPDIGDIASRQIAVECQPRENVGNLVRQHRRCVESLTRLNPARQVSLDRGLTLVCNHQRDDQAGIDDHGHPFDLTEDGPAIAAITTQLRRRHATDSSYIRLAIQLGTALWTLDGALARNAAGVGLPVNLIT